MIDFVEYCYYKNHQTNDDNYDKEKAMQKALEVVLPMVMDNYLTPKERICIKYKYELNKTQCEIAEMLRISQPTVSRCINNAKDKLNDILKYTFCGVTVALNEYENIS